MNNYTVTYKILLASEYVVPQNRRSAFSIGLKNGKIFIFPEPTTQSFIICEQAIGDLPNETIGDVEGYSIEAQINYQRLMRMDSNISYFFVFCADTKPPFKATP